MLPKDVSLTPSMGHREGRNPENLYEAASRFLWPTATSGDAGSFGAAGYSTESGRHSGTTLTDAAKLWPTPQAQEDGSTPEAMLARKERANVKRKAGLYADGCGSPSMLSLSLAANLWSTPRTMDGSLSGETREDWEERRARKKAANPNLGDLDIPLSSQVLWMTATTRDWKDGACADADVPTNGLLGRQVLRTETAGSDGSGKAVLNPSFVEALMGFPPGWTVPTGSALSATPSSPPRPEPPSSSLQGGC